MMNVPPPKRALQFLRWFCREDYLEEIEGDLTEVFKKQYEISPRKAKWKFTWSVVKYFRPEFIRPLRKYPSNDMSMHKSYFIAAIRSFKKSKFHMLINVFGLAIGIMASLLAIVFVLDEFSFDNLHTKRDRLYRLNKISYESNGSSYLNAESSGMMGPTMASEFGEVERIVRYQPWDKDLVLSYHEQHVELDEGVAVFVDSTFFDVFDFSLIRGNPKTVLTRPLTVVLTESVAANLFGEEDPIGKSITGINGLEFEVTGIAMESPRNSHIQFRALVSWTTTVPKLGPLNFEWMNNWIAQTISTYVLVKPGVSVDALQSKLDKFMHDHLPARAQVYKLYLQPLNEVYLNAYNIKYHRMAKTGNRQYIYIFSIIAGIILFIACVNYVNINTSRSTRRAREVGMRKSMGATRKQLIHQFLGESLLITSVATVVALVFLYFVIPLFNELTGKSLPAGLLLDTRVIAGMIMLVLSVSLISGLYPAVILSGFNPAEVLKASAKNKISGNLPRHILIAFQFVISIVMLACTLLVYRQMKFVLSKDMGFDKEHVLVVSLTNDILLKGKTFQQEVALHPDVVSTSLGRLALGQSGSSTYIVPEGFPPDEIEVQMFRVDGNFQKTYSLEMAMGRFFDVPGHASDSGALIINESLARKLQWTYPMQKTIRFNEGDDAYSIIGVLKDFHFHSLYEEVKPLVMWIDPTNQRNLSVRFAGNPARLVDFLNAKWKVFENRYPFSYYFVDEAYAKAYQADEKLFKTVILFAGLSIFIASLGLYGLVSFTIEQRTKEFGIRKVLGATAASLNFLVNRTFILMIILATVAAVPIVIALMNKWLSRFAYKIEIGPETFILSFIITLVITVSAVSLQTIKAALANPVKSLRAD